MVSDYGPLRVVVDAMCAEFGGIRTYVEHLLANWGSAYPEDELVVLVPRGSSLPTFGHERREVAVGRPRQIGRPWAQSVHVRRAVRATDRTADAVLATLPSTTLRNPGAPMTVVVYDLRHELRPAQFTRWQRLLRTVSYGQGYRMANGIVAISQRSLDDLHELHPRIRGTHSEVAHLGADHVRTWPASGRSGPAIAYAHHSNKNLDLVLDGWAEATRREPSPGPLLILGVGAARRQSLQGEIERRGLGGVVSLAPFLPEPAFQHAMAAASMIVFPTDFEGFGLPVVEGLLLGKPVVIGPERATTEVSGGYAVQMGAWTPQALADGIARARSLTSEQVEEGQRWAGEFTWERTVRSTRSMLVRTIATASSG